MRTTAFAVVCAALLTGTLSGQSLQCFLSWKDNSNNETGFEMQRAVGSAPEENAFRPLVTTGANVTSFVDIELETGQTYTWRLRSFDASSQSAWISVTAVAQIGPTAPGEFGADIQPLGTPEPQPPFTVRSQAEAAQMSGGWTIVDDATGSTAGRGWAQCLAASGGADTIAFPFVIPLSGEYQLRARVLSPNLQSDSYFVTVNGTRYVWTVNPIGDDWTEHTVTLRDGPETITFAPGTHTVTFSYREACRLDWVEVVAVSVPRFQ